MEISLFDGIYVDASPDFRSALPLNYVPTPKDTGISSGYLAPADGLVEFAASLGVVRGSINWNGVCYQVQGEQLASVSQSGAATALGAIGGAGSVTMDYSFDRLGIAAGGTLYFYKPGEGVTQVTDLDIGYVVDAMYLDGYWLATDGSYIAQSELTNPYDWQTTKYGSSEADPDPIVALFRNKDELNAVNRYTTETFQNKGGTGFAFQRAESALVMCGAVGTYMVCDFADNIAVVGGGRNEPPSVYLVGGGDRAQLSNAEVDKVLGGYSEETLSHCFIESRTYNRHQQLMIHLPDRTLVYDIASTKLAQGKPVWFELSSAIQGSGQYRAQHWVWAYDKWIFGDPVAARTGYAESSISTHYGEAVGWSVNTSVLYNQSLGAVIHQLELVGLPGRVAFGKKPTIWTSYTTDGETWSQERSISAGVQGQRHRRLVWLQQGLIRNYRIQRFRGTSDAHLPIARLEMQLEALSA